MSYQWWQWPERRTELEEALADLSRARELLAERGGVPGVQERVREALESAAELERRVSGKSRLRSEPLPNSAAALDARVDLSLGRPSTKLAIYGTLAPGEVNHWVVADLEGAWHQGFVRGRLRQVGWGAGYGFPALSWQPDGDRVAVKVLVAARLRDRWQRLDTFEGHQYRRILVPVEREGMILAVANLYAARG